MCHETHHGSGALWFVNKVIGRSLVGSRVLGTCIGKQVTDWYALRKLLKQLTVHSPRVLWILRSETVAVRVTIDTERDGDS